MTAPDTNSPYPDEPGVQGGLYGQQLGHVVPAQPIGGQGEADPWAGYEDYFGFDERVKWYFPDGKQWIEFKKLTEGDRAKYLKATRSDVHLNQQTKEARMALDQSQDRKQLLLHSITDWHIVHIQGSGPTRRVTPVPFVDNRTPGGELSKWIDRQDPALLADLEKKIRKVNPWLMADMTVAQIDKEIADLQELRTAAEEREAREGSFPTAG